MTHSIALDILVMALVTFAVRVTPMTLLRRQIRNQFIQSFLYYVPYVTLAVMTFPAMVEATQSPISGAAALVLGIVAAWMGFNLFQVAVSCCLLVFAVEYFLIPGATLF